MFTEEPVAQTTTTFENAWTEYMDTLRGMGKRMLVSLLERAQAAYDGIQEFSLQAPHKVAAEMIEDEKQDMLIFLRRRTGNSSLNLRIDILQTETEITPYTNREKFDSLAQKNPKLMDLKNALDLEIE